MVGDARHVQEVAVVGGVGAEEVPDKQQNGDDGVRHPHAYAGFADAGYVCTVCVCGVAVAAVAPAHAVNAP